MAEVAVRSKRVKIADAVKFQIVEMLREIKQDQIDSQKLTVKKLVAMAKSKTKCDAINRRHIENVIINSNCGLKPYKTFYGKSEKRADVSSELTELRSYIGTLQRELQELKSQLGVG